RQGCPGRSTLYRPEWAKPEPAMVFPAMAEGALRGRRGNAFFGAAEDFQGDLHSALDMQAGGLASLVGAPREGGVVDRAVLFVDVTRHVFGQQRNVPVALVLVVEGAVHAQQQ